MEKNIKETGELESLIERELTFFPTDTAKAAFRQLSVTPYEQFERWGYSEELHSCWVVAQDSRYQIVYCQTGFGSAFPWSTQGKGATDLGMDSDWCAYLLEAFVSSGIWSGETPADLELMGPGERG